MSGVVTYNDGTTYSSTGTRYLGLHPLVDLIWLFEGTSGSSAQTGPSTGPVDTLGTTFTSWNISGSGASITYDTAMSNRVSGTTGLKFVNGSVANQGASIKCPFKTPTPATNIHAVITPHSGLTSGPAFPLLCVRNNATPTPLPMLRLNQTSAGKLFITSGASVNSGVPVYGGSASFIKNLGGSDLVVSAGTQYRIELQMLVNTATAAQGSFAIQIYNAVTDELLNLAQSASVQSGTADLGQIPLLNCEFGYAGSGTAGLSLFMGVDEVVMRDGSTQPYGPWQPSTIRMFNTNTVDAGTGVITGGTDAAVVLTPFVSPDNDYLTYSVPTYADPILTGTMVPISPPNRSLVTTWSMSRSSASSGYAYAELWTPGDLGTRVSTTVSSPQSIPSTTPGDVVITFPWADILNVSAQNWAGGMVYKLFVTAAV